ncbi:hypothetical protein [uncultured Brachyspira sp.]|uniref:hypothetical protein n=1 Tax=uncultured Brachyspira sp. TaxID=221953 RepID=UPI002635777F|nr:hypothetical protein [uncultured Brachyspira sp.]
MRELYKKFDSKKLDKVLAKLNKIDMHPKVDEYSFYVYKAGEYEEYEKKELYKKINCLIDMYDTNKIDMSILLQAVNYLYKNIDEHYITLNYKGCFFFFVFTKIKAIMESKNEREIQVYNALYFLYDMYFYNRDINIKAFLSNDYVIVSEEFDNENFDINKYMEDIKKIIMELDEHSFYSYAEKDFKDAKFENINLLLFYFNIRPFKFGESNPLSTMFRRKLFNDIDGFLDNAIEYLNTVRFINNYKYLTHYTNVERLEYIYFWTDDYLALDIFTTDANVYNLLAQYNYFKYLKTKDEKYKDIAISYIGDIVLSVTRDASMTFIERADILFKNMFYILFRECESYSDFEVIIYAIALKISDFRYNYLCTYKPKYKNENGETCYFKYNYNTKKMALDNYYYSTRKNEIEQYLVSFGHTKNNGDNNEDALKVCKEELDILKPLCYEFTRLEKDLKDIEKIQKIQKIIDICTTLNINYILKFSRLKFDKYDDEIFENGFDIITDNTIIYEAIENIKLIYRFYYTGTKAKELNLYLKLNEQIVSYINILKNEKKYDIIEQIIMSLKEYINADDYKNKLEPVLVESLHFLGKYKSCLDIFKEDSFTDYSLIVKLINISVEANILNTNIKIQNKNIILRIYEILTFSSKDLVVTSLFNFIEHINIHINPENNWYARTVNIYYKNTDLTLCYDYDLYNKKGKFDKDIQIAVNQLRNTLTHISNDYDVNKYIKEYRDAMEFTKTNYSKILECMFNVIKKNNILTRKGLNDLYIF